MLQELLAIEAGIVSSLPHTHTHITPQKHAGQGSTRHPRRYYTLGNLMPRHCEECASLEDTNQCQAVADLDTATPATFKRPQHKLFPCFAALSPCICSVPHRHKAAPTAQRLVSPRDAVTQRETPSFERAFVDQWWHCRLQVGLASILMPPSGPGRRRCATGTRIQHPCCRPSLCSRPDMA